ncbi:MAG: hypothetical protein QMD09_06320 [Desulfatibacillaceae bacterium]|nr:hypothetical protein [Desulfatibacillaceae bacterium]
MAQNSPQKGSPKGPAEKSGQRPPDGAGAEKDPFVLSGNGHERVGPGPSRNTGLMLGKDFATGCLTLVVAAFILGFAAFLAAVAYLAFRVALWLAVPLGVVLALILLATLLGRIVNAFAAWRAKNNPPERW